MADRFDSETRPMLDLLVNDSSSSSEKDEVNVNMDTATDIDDGEIHLFEFEDIPVWPTPMQEHFATKL